jgi:hypothetical protein
MKMPFDKKPSMSPRIMKIEASIRQFHQGKLDCYFFLAAPLTFLPFSSIP